MKRLLNIHSMEFASCVAFSPFSVNIKLWAMLLPFRYAVVAIYFPGQNQLSGRGVHISITKGGSLEKTHMVHIYRM